MIKASKTTRSTKGGLPLAIHGDDQQQRKTKLVKAAFTTPIKPPMYVSLSMNNLLNKLDEPDKPVYKIAVNARCFSTSDAGSDSEAPSVPSHHSEPPSSDNEASPEIIPQPTTPTPTPPSPTPSHQPMRADVQRLIDVLPDAVNSAEAAQEARSLLRSVQANLESNWRVLDELVPGELFHQLQQCCIVKDHPIKRMALITLTYIADLITVSDDAYRLTASLFPEGKGLPEILYKCESFIEEPNAPFEERFAYALFFNLMCRESPEDFVQLNRLPALLCHCVRRMELQHQAMQDETYCCPTLVPTLLKKLDQLVGFEAVWKAKEDPSAYWQYLYAYTTHDPRTRLLVAKFMGLDAQALRDMRAAQMTDELQQAKLAEQLAARDAGMLPLAQYELQQARYKLQRASRPVLRACGRVWMRGMRAVKAAVAAAMADDPPSP